MSAGLAAEATRRPVAPTVGRRSSRRVVTVVIPVWDDYAAVVEEAVESVRLQDLEASILVVDNASRRPLPWFPPDVTTVRLAERLSVGAARNVGLALVRTDCVLFLDADDVLTPGTLSLLVGGLAAAPSSAACCCGVVAWNAGSGQVARLDFPSRFTRAMARWATGYRLYAAFRNRMPTTGCVLMRTSFARAAGGFTDAEFAEDWPLNVGLAFRGRIRFLDPVGRQLRVHPTSLRARRRSRVEVAGAYALLRRRLASDRATPVLLRLALPLLALHHAWQVRRLTPDGVMGPGRALALVGDPGPLAPQPREGQA
jgi:hypothetical protein